MLPLKQIFIWPSYGRHFLGVKPTLKLQNSCSELKLFNKLNNSGRKRWLVSVVQKGVVREAQTVDF